MESFIGEIQIFPYTFAPRQWAFCDGQLLQISQYTTVFAILGVAFGGDGRTTFAVPNLKGRAPMHWGNGSGLSQHMLGQQTGAANVTLTDAQIPTHTHAVQADATQADQSAPTTTEVLGEGYAPGGRRGGKPEPLYTAASSANATMNGATIANAGGATAHNNMQPFLALNFCIALEGLFPARN